MVERHWRGIAFPDKADQYIYHLTHETLPELEAMPGFKGLSILRRDTEKSTAFLIITRWETPDAIRQFSGNDLEVAVVPDVVKSMMLQYELRAEHYTVVSQSDSRG